MRAAHAAVLRKPNPAVRNKLSRFDLTDSCFNQATVLSTLFFRDRCFEVLDFGQAFSHEHNHAHFGDPTDPGIANQLRVERKQSVGLVGISIRRGLPVDQAMLPVELPQGIDIGNEFIASGESTNHLDLQVLLRAADVDTILLRESLEQMDSLVDHTVPGVSFAVCEGSLADTGPFFE